MNRDESFHAASHFGMGAAPSDLASARHSARDWVVSQLDADVTIAGLPDAAATIARIQAYRIERRQMRQAANGDDQRIDALDEQRDAFQRENRVALADTFATRFNHAIDTAAPVKERLALFWSNHFTVSQAGKPQILNACTSFENEAIRANLDGYFAEMLLRVTSHPVMLLYLDNAQSVGLRSTVGRRRDAGINENLAREILELHTLGAVGGFDQEDVKALAAMLTGWTVGNPRLARLGATPGAFTFVEAMHEPGPQRLLGKRYAEAGFDQARAALADLAIHPATARHIAHKLVRHFVADAPPANAVDVIARVFTASRGYLPAVHEAVLKLPSAWERSHAKFKTPYELLVSTARGLRAGSRRDPVRRGAANMLRTLNQMPFTAPSPAGWPDVADHWMAPNALKQRIEWGILIGERLGNRFDARELAPALAGPTGNDELFSVINRAESPAQGLALLLSSPRFQWR